MTREENEKKQHVKGLKRNIALGKKRRQEFGSSPAGSLWELIQVQNQIWLNSIEEKS